MAAAWPLASDGRASVLSLHVADRSIRALVLDAISLDVLAAVKVPLDSSTSSWLLSVVAGLDGAFRGVPSPDASA